jgi:hypothetical protein
MTGIPLQNASFFSDCVTSPGTLASLGMRPMRRAVSLLTGVLVLQLTLLGAAAPCVEQEPAAPPGAGGVTSGESADSHTADCGEHSSAPAGTKLPGTPTCLAMVSCVTAALNLGAQQLSGSGVIATDVVIALSLEPTTRNTVPEPPPPRA